MMCRLSPLALLIFCIVFAAMNILIPKILKVMELSSLNMSFLYGGSFVVLTCILVAYYLSVCNGKKYNQLKKQEQL